jgi:annexin A7/11
MNFNASNDAVSLRNAMKGFGTNEDAIIEVLCRRTNAQRMEIVRCFKTSYGKDLLSEIRSETSGNFEKLLLALLTPTSEYYARELHEAISGAGTDEDALIEVMCTMSNYEIRCISAMYQRFFGRSLEQELQGDTSGCFRRLMTSLSCGSRDESMVTDVNQAKIDAQELKRAGIDKWGTDESTFNRILCQRNYEQIKLIAREYQSLTGHTLEKDIKKEFSGDIEDGLLTVLRVAESRPDLFAQRLHKSMAGLGTKDRSLIRLVATRCEIDMLDIKEAFVHKYGKTLKSFIKGDTSGHYRHALYALIGENRS